MRKILIGVFGAVSASFLLSIFATPAEAIPAFARKYDVPCSLCHSAFPKLNDFGAAFRDRGYRLGGEKDNPVNQPGAYFPIAFRTPVGYQYVTQSHQATLEGDRTIRSGSFQDLGVDILSIGTLAEKISHHLVFVVGPDNTIGLESAWIRFNDLNGTPWLNLKAGIFEMDVPFTTKRILTLGAGYPVYDFHPAGSVVEMSFSENQMGLELMGHGEDGKVRYALDLVQGSNTELRDRENINPDLYGHVTYRLAGQRLGAFVYLGQEETKFLHDATTTDPIESTGKNPKPFYRYGADLTLRKGMLDLLILGMTGIEPKKLIDTDGDPANDIQASERNGQFYGGLFEANLHLNPKLVLIGRYDLVRNTRQPDPAVARREGDIDQIVFAVRKGIHISTRSDVFLHAEVSSQTTTAVGGPNVRENRYLVAYDFAF